MGRRDLLSAPWLHSPRLQSIGVLRRPGRVRLRPVHDRRLFHLEEWPRSRSNAGFSATTTISRKAWGLTWNQGLETGGWLVGDDIKIEIELELVKAQEAVPAQQSIGQKNDVVHMADHIQNRPAIVTRKWQRRTVPFPGFFESAFQRITHRLPKPKISSISTCTSGDSWKYFCQY